MPPKLAKGKTPADDAPAKKKAGANKKNLHVMPEKLVKGTILQDLVKNKWCVGDSIGIGGFGEIYSACKAGTTKYDYVVKCEPHGNGPLFTEMHFYMRNAKKPDIEQFKKDKKLAFLGMPYMLGNGSVEINGNKHRFIVMPKYGNDLRKYVKEGGDRLLEATVYRLAIQMLDVYEFIHSTGYSHGDLKAANILLGINKEDLGLAYLVDFGLASSIKDTEYKPNPKKMHNGTIEYTSIDSHFGVSTRRSDFEILGYNLIEWMGNVLPWVKDGILKVPVKVQKSKEAFMENIDELVDEFQYSKPIGVYLKYIKELEHNEVPDYEYCKSIFEKALKKLNVNNSGPLQFTKHVSTDHSTSPPKPPKENKAAVKRTHRQRKVEQNNSMDSENEDDFVFAKQPDSRQTPKRVKAASVSKQISLREKSKNSPVTRSTHLAEQNKNHAELENLKSTTTPRGRTPNKRHINGLDDSLSESPPKVKSLGATLGSATKKPKNPSATPKDSPIPSTRSTPLKAQINFSPSISIQSSPIGRNAGKTVINDDYVPSRNGKKTFEVNLQLDVSMDTDVVINVERKKKSNMSSHHKGSIRLNKVHNDENNVAGSSTNLESPNVGRKRNK